MYLVPNYYSFDSNHGMTGVYRDEFERKKIAENIIKLLTAGINEISPIMINGNWGSGKTEFCFKLYNLIKNSETIKAKPLYINAFKPDYTDDAFMVIVQGLYSLLENDSQKEEFIKKSKNYAKRRIFNRDGAKNLGKAIVKDIVSATQKPIENTVNHFINEDENFSNLYQQQLEIFSAETEQFNAFKDYLTTTAKDEPIIIIIDELDRCRPDFALSILENIKHLFDIPNIHFIISCNLDQLSAMIKRNYGETLDTESYLDKFFSHKILLNNHNQDLIDDSNIKEYFKKSVFSYDGHDYINNHLNSMLNHCYDEIIINILSQKFSLRQRDKLKSHLLTYFLIKGDDLAPINIKTDIFYSAILIGVIIFIKNPHIANKILDDELLPSELALFLDLEYEWDFTFNKIFDEVDNNELYNENSFFITFESKYPCISKILFNIYHTTGNNEVKLKDVSSDINIMKNRSSFMSSSFIYSSVRNNSFNQIKNTIQTLNFIS